MDPASEQMVQSTMSTGQLWQAAETRHMSHSVVCVPHNSADMAAAARCSAAPPLPPPDGGFSTRANVMCSMSGCLRRQASALAVHAGTATCTSAAAGWAWSLYHSLVHTNPMHATAGQLSEMSGSNRMQNSERRGAIASPVFLDCAVQDTTMLQTML